MKHPILKLVAIILSIYIPIAHAASDIVIEKSSKVVELNADGTFSQTNELMVRLVSEQGAKGMGQVPLAYSESLQTMDIVEAYTLKPDGTRLNVPADKIFTQAAPIAVSAPMFNDIKYKIIVFPEPLAGGKVYFRLNVKQKTPFFPSHFSHYELISSLFPLEAFSFRLSAPIGYAIKTDVREVAGGKLPDKDGRSHWEWTYKNPVGRSADPFELAGSDFGPYIAMSSFADWSGLARAYADRAKGKVAVTPEIQMLADDITKGLIEPKAQTEAIYRWVARNVRYVGVFLGLGGFVPRDVSDILKTKYGDCKDHTVILETLLKAKGIDSTPVMISTLPSFKLPKVPTVGSFNHAITYVPSLDMYLDSTASFARFGELPNADAGKPVLQIDNGKLAHTPTATAAMDTVFNRVEMTMTSDGSISGRSEIVTKGEPEARLRQMIAAVPANQQDTLVTRWLGSTQKGSGTISSGEVSDLTKPFTLAANFEIKDAVSVQSPGAFPIPQGFFYRDIHRIISTGGLNTENRNTPFICGSGTHVDEMILNLPSEIKVLALPKNVIHKDTAIMFEATYRQEGQKILVNRKLVATRTTEHCEPFLWDEIVRVSGVLTRDAKAQVLIQ